MEIPNATKEITPQHVANELGFLAKEREIYKKSAVSDGNLFLELRKVDEFNQAWIRINKNGFGKFWEREVTALKENGYPVLLKKLQDTKNAWEEKAQKMLPEIVSGHDRFAKIIVDLVENGTFTENCIDLLESQGRVLFSGGEKTTWVIELQYKYGGKIEIDYGNAKRIVKDPLKFQLRTLTCDNKYNFWDINDLERGLAEAKKRLRI